MTKLNLIYNDFLELLLLAFSIKTLIFGGSFPDAVVMIGILSGIIYKLHKIHLFENKDENLDKKIQDLSSKVDGLMLVNGLRNVQKK